MVETKLAVILHADVVGSTRLVQLDERIAHERIRDAFRRFAEVITEYGGTTHEIRGDALVAEFGKTSEATTAALTFQAENLACNETLDGEIRPVCRIGIALGEVVIADNTLTGAGVVLAQRLEQLAEPDGVVVSVAVHGATPKRLGFSYVDLGQQDVKGFDDPIGALAVCFSAAKNQRAPEAAHEEGEPNAAPDKPSVAVMPFENLSGDSEEDYFVDGVTEDIITSLSQFRWLFVIARNSVFSYKGQAVDVRDVSRELGVRYVVEGSIRKSGNRLRTSAQLVDASTGHQIWAHRYDSALTDIFALQDEITEAIVSEVEPELSAVERDRARRKLPGNLDAWDCVLRGRWHLYKFTAEGYAEAQRFFERATHLDATFALGFASLAFVRYSSVRLGYVESSDEIIAQAYDAARTALSLDARDDYCHMVMGAVHFARREHDAAVAELERAVELNPNAAHNHYFLGFVYLAAGKPEEAISECDAALRLSPHDPIAWAFLGIRSQALLIAGRYDQAIESARNAIRRPNSEFWPRSHLVSALGHLGRLDEARAELADLMTMRTDFSLELVTRTSRFRSSANLEHILDGLRAAGAPENADATSSDGPSEY